MTERSPARDPDVPAWILWPVRAVAVVTIVPLRLLWELLGAVARVVAPPIAWVWHYVVVVPLSFLWHYVVVVPLSFLWRYLVAVPVSFLWHYLVVVPVVWVAKWLWARREPIGRFLTRFVFRPVAWVLYYVLVVPIVWIARTLKPVWRALGHAIVAVWKGTGQVLTLLGRGIAFLFEGLYRFVLRPFGQAAAWLWRNTIVLVARGIAAVWRATVVPVWRATAVPLGRWVRDAILRPTAATLRVVLTALGLRRAR